MAKETDGANRDARNKPSDLDGPGYSDKPFRPGYPLKSSLQKTSEEDLKRGFKKE